jgi:hypothetical protein
MKRLLAISGPAFAVSVVFLLVGVAALSAATRRPYREAGKGAWHISKVGHMIEAEGHGSSVTQPAELTDDVEVGTGPSPETYAPHKELLPDALALIIQKHHFRSPPVLP